jgi:hypothetical protein
MSAKADEFFFHSFTSRQHQNSKFFTQIKRAAQFALKQMNS